MSHIEQRCECEYIFNNLKTTGFALVYAPAAAPDILMVDAFHCRTRKKNTLSKENKLLSRRKFASDVNSTIVVTSIQNLLVDW